MAEKWYIECEKVIDELIRFGMTEDGEAIIRNIPAADVRPVLYCKDCKHRFNYDICTCRGDNWFCGYGERK